MLDSAEPTTLEFGNQRSAVCTFRTVVRRSTLLRKSALGLVALLLRDVIEALCHWARTDHLERLPLLLLRSLLLSALLQTSEQLRKLLTHTTKPIEQTLQTAEVERRKLRHTQVSAEVDQRPIRHRGERGRSVGQSREPLVENPVGDVPGQLVVGIEPLPLTVSPSDLTHRGSRAGLQSHDAWERAIAQATLRSLLLRGRVRPSRVPTNVPQTAHRRFDARSGNATEAR